MLFVTVAARIVGIVGRLVAADVRHHARHPARPRLDLCRGRLGDPAARAGVLTVGTIVAVAATKAGDISQDLKTG